MGCGTSSQSHNGNGNSKLQTEGSEYQINKVCRRAPICLLNGVFGVFVHSPMAYNERSKDCALSLVDCLVDRRIVVEIDGVVVGVCSYAIR